MASRGITRHEGRYGNALQMLLLVFTAESIFAVAHRALKAQ
jgi:hypothetical protein